MEETSLHNLLSPSGWLFQAVISQGAESKFFYEVPFNKLPVIPLILFPYPDPLS